MAPDTFDPRTETTDPRVGPYDAQARQAAADNLAASEAQRLAEVADTEMWAVAWNQWHDAHLKLNTHRNGMYDDPVKHHEGYLDFPDAGDRPFQLWEGEPY